MNIFAPLMMILYNRMLFINLAYTVFQRKPNSFMRCFCSQDFFILSAVSVLIGKFMSTKSSSRVLAFGRRFDHGEVTFLSSDIQRYPSVNTVEYISSELKIHIHTVYSILTLHLVRAGEKYARIQITL